MLKNINRLPLQKENKNLHQEGQAFYTPLFKAIKKNNKEGVSRFGFIVNKKIDNRAVIRNSIKRKMREAASKYLNTKPPVDILMIANKKSITATTAELGKTLGNILVKN